MQERALGKEYNDGDIIVRQGDVGECMYVIQSGHVEVLKEGENGEISLAILGRGDCFGEMAVFEREVRSATARAKGKARVLTIDKRTFLQRVHEDPSFAFRLLRSMSQRIRHSNKGLLEARSSKLPGDEEPS